MRLINSRWTFSALFVVSVTALAQPMPTAQSAISPVASPGTNLPRVGTKVHFELSEPLATKHKAVRAGQFFALIVSENVKVDGVVVLPAGSYANGFVNEVRKSGRLSAQIQLEVNHVMIPLSATFYERGTIVAVVLEGGYIPNGCCTDRQFT